MSEENKVIEYKCPCCNAGLVFGAHVQQLTCEYCDNTFDIEAIRAYNDADTEKTAETFSWDYGSKNEWDEAEEAALNTYQCPACGGEILTDDTTAATFCPFCDNPTIMPTRLNRGLKPDAVLPFQKNR